MATLPTPGPAPTPSNTLDPTLTGLSAGQISGFRWRGPRQSAPLLALVESLCADVLSLSRRAFTGRLTPAAATTAASPTIGPDASALQAGPQTWQLACVRVQSLRAQITFRTSSDEV